MSDRLEFVVDSVLQSGRCFGRNYFDRDTPVGTKEEFFESLVEQSQILGRNLARSIPLGTTFYTIRMTRVIGNTPKLETIDVGVIASISLTLKTVEWYRRSIDVVPGGHTAGLTVAGVGLQTVVNALMDVNDREYVSIATS